MTAAWRRWRRYRALYRDEKRAFFAWQRHSWYRKDLVETLGYGPEYRRSLEEGDALYGEFMRLKTQVRRFEETGQLPPW